jgi:protein TonB
MSSASLAVVPHAQPDRVHIAALSTAIALNLAVLMVALRPLPASMPAAFPLRETLTIRFPDLPKPLPPAPPALDVKPLPPTAPPAHRAAPTPVTPPVVVPFDQGTVAAPPIAPPALTPSAPSASPPAPVQASLAYRAAPLRFPPQAIRQHMHGTVLLRVLVDEQGKPLTAEVELSSGHVLLDRSARQQVLASWLFEPAVIGGRHVRAWARVPVKFDLQER